VGERHGRPQPKPGGPTGFEEGIESADKPARRNPRGHGTSAGKEVGNGSEAVFGKKGNAMNRRLMAVILGLGFVCGCSSVARRAAKVQTSLADRQRPAGCFRALCSEAQAGGKRPSRTVPDMYV
jgi:hypothetical protein